MPPNAHASVEFDTMRRASVSVKEADRKSETDTEMRREPNIGGYEQINRMSTNRDLSSLTNQILELIIDNVKMVHINQKLVEYFKLQSQTLEFSAEKTQSSLQEAIKGQNSTESELAQEIITLKSELENER